MVMEMRKIQQQIDIGRSAAGLHEECEFHIQNGPRLSSLHWPDAESHQPMPRLRCGDR